MSGPLGSGIAAIRRFYRPFILIQSVAVAVLVGYHQSAAVRAVCAVLAGMKTRGGLPFAALTAAVAGGVLPELAKLVGDGRRYRLAGRAGELLFNLAFFAVNGVVIDLLYRGEARLFGNDDAVSTIALKTAFDQFFFTPLWLPLIISLYLWRRQGFSATATAARLRQPHFYRNRVLPLLLPDWFFWIPMVSVIYALPGPLQFVLFILALGAWSLIMVFIAEASAGMQDADAAPPMATGTVA